MRLYYSLSTMDLEDNFQEKLLQQQCKKLTKDSLVFIDGSDIIKEKSNIVLGIEIYLKLIAKENNTTNIDGNALVFDFLKEIWFSNQN